MAEEKFICDDCELNQLAFGWTHTNMHTVVRVSDGDEGKGPSMEEQLRLVKDELVKMRQDFEEVKGMLMEVVEGVRGSFRDMAEEMGRNFRDVAQSHAEMRQEAEEVRRGFREVARTHAETRRDFEEVKGFMEVVRVVVETR